jgi:hypothetical protein
MDEDFCLARRPSSLTSEMDAVSPVSAHKFQLLATTGQATVVSIAKQI